MWETVSLCAGIKQILYFCVFFLFSFLLQFTLQSHSLYICTVCTYSPYICTKKWRRTPNCLLIGRLEAENSSFAVEAGGYPPRALDVLAVMRRSHKEAGGRGPRCPGRRRSQRPIGRFCRSPWQRTSSRPPPAGQGRGNIVKVDGRWVELNSNRAGRQKEGERFTGTN